jgi:cysteine desulfurase family protein
MQAHPARIPIYLDNASTTFPKPRVVYDAVAKFAKHCGASPGRGAYPAAVEAGEVIESCRRAVARVLGVADAARISFTANSTEAINDALHGLLVRPGDHAVVTSLEHNAVVRPLRQLERTRGVVWTVVPCGSDGTCDPASVAAAIRKETRVVCVTHASNVFGTVLPIAEIAALAHDRGVAVLVDGSQTAGVIPLSVETDRIDFFAFTGHKGLLGPPGTGGLYVRPGLSLPALKQGGTGTRSESMEHPSEMPEALEAGTSNSWGLAGLRAGTEWLLARGLGRTCAQEHSLAARLAAELRALPHVRVYGPETRRQSVPVVTFNVGMLRPEDIAALLASRYDLAVRAGLHCAPLAHRTAGTLDRGGGVRMSLGPFNVESDVDSAVRAVSEIASAAYRTKERPACPTSS